jgi:hypothetical protein
MVRAFKMSDRYRVILYWRPIVPGLNDSPKHLERAYRYSAHAHATVFTGLFYREEMDEYFRSVGIEPPFPLTARRKILPRALEQRVLRFFGQAKSRPVFRKTSCGVAFVHEVPDYNGHYGIRELCDICPAEQVGRCASSFRRPTEAEVRRLAKEVGGSPGTMSVDDRAVTVSNLDDSQRYFLQHHFQYQIHDVGMPHFHGRHGRAELGWEGGTS